MGEKIAEMRFRKQSFVAQMALSKQALNTSNRYLELFDEQKNGHKVQIESLGDIYNYAELLLGVVEGYDGVGEER